MFICLCTSNNNSIILILKIEDTYRCIYINDNRYLNGLIALVKLSD